MKAIILDGVMAGRCIDLTRSEASQQQWRATMSWAGLRARHQDYFTVMTNVGESICVMSIHQRYTEREFINQVIGNLVASGADEYVIDRCELQLDSGLFDKAALDTIQEMAAINFWVLQMQNAEAAKSVGKID